MSACVSIVVPLALQELEQDLHRGCLRETVHALHARTWGVSKDRGKSVQDSIGTAITYYNCI